MVRKIMSVAVIALLAIPLWAEQGEKSSLEEAIFGGQVDLNLRMRAEFVEQEGVDHALAITERLRLGYGSGVYKGFSFYLDFEDIRAADDDRYNAAGLNDNPNKAIVADPEDTELNQAYLKYADDDLTAIFGRQRIVLDDHRFVGNVGWRQNEQTFDAMTLISQPTQAWTVFYSYIWDINRIFGPDSGRDLTSNSHVVNILYTGLPEKIGKVTVFAYSLEVDEAATLSSDTYGFRLSGSNAIGDDTTLDHTLSYASQSDGRENPLDYEADYYLLEGKVTKKGVGSAGVGYEVLGSDDDKAGFSTPLATLHRHNGWADAFLDTPAGGLEDVYLFAGTKLAGETTCKAIFHWFRANESGGDFGQELDIILSKPINERMKVLSKFADFNGKGSFADRTKFWVQAEYVF